LPGGPVGPASRWAATSNAEVGQTTYPVNRGRVGREGRGVRPHEEEREGGSETGEEAKELSSGPLLRRDEGGLYFEISVGAPRVPSYATTDCYLARAGLKSQSAAGTPTRHIIGHFGDKPFMGRLHY